jgi:hypothetical protein
MGKSTISMAIFNSKLLVYQRVKTILATKSLKPDETRWGSLAPTKLGSLPWRSPWQINRKIVQVMKDHNDSYENHFGGSSILRNPPFHDVDGWMVEIQKAWKPQKKAKYGPRHGVTQGFCWELWSSKKIGLDPILPMNNWIQAPKKHWTILNQQKCR